ncbi:MAG: thiamine phosphate synthase [Pseudomonadota bacterium]
MRARISARRSTISVKTLFVAIMNHQAESDPKGKFRRASARIRRHMPSNLPTLLVLTDPNRTPDPAALALRMPPGTGFIYRHFGAVNRTETAIRISEIARRQRLCFLIGNDPELARLSKADGVHWAEVDMTRSRHWKRSFRVMTTAAHCQRALAHAASLPLDAALTSAVFQSRSPSAETPIGRTRLRAWCKKARIPVYALGGINAQNVGQIKDFAGAASIDGAAAAFGI